MTVRQPDVEPIPDRAQLPLRRLLKMGVGALRHHLAASLLQVATIAATAAFLSFVLARIVMERAAPALGISTGDAEGKLAQLVWLLVVALLVCTISNITSMLLSVTKRFRDIGTMKCLGAFDGSILALFMIEALILGGTGATLGAAAGFLVSLAAAFVSCGPAMLAAHVVAQMAGGAALTVAVVALLSFVGAAYPAWLASRMLPVEAMRSV